MINIDWVRSNRRDVQDSLAAVELVHPKPPEARRRPSARLHPMPSVVGALRNFRSLRPRSPRIGQRRRFTSGTRTPILHRRYWLNASGVFRRGANSAVPARRPAPRHCIGRGSRGGLGQGRGPCPYGTRSGRLGSLARRSGRHREGRGSSRPFHTGSANERPPVAPGKLGERKREQVRRIAEEWPLPNAPADPVPIG
jgi:hypothetical protein